MNKATTWARQGRRVMQFRESLTPFQRRRHMEPLTAQVACNGKLDMSHEHMLSRREALRLAHWILAIFGEPS